MSTSKVSRSSPDCYVISLSFITVNVSCSSTTAIDIDVGVIFKLFSAMYILLLANFGVCALGAMRHYH